MLEGILFYRILQRQVIRRVTHSRYTERRLIIAEYHRAVVSDDVYGVFSLSSDFSAISERKYSLYPPVRLKA